MSDKGAEIKTEMTCDAFYFYSYAKQMKTFSLCKHNVSGSWGNGSAGAGLAKQRLECRPEEFTFKKTICLSQMVGTVSQEQNG